LETKKVEKSTLGLNVAQGRSKRNANFQLKRSKVKVTGCQKPPEIAAFWAFVFTYRRWLGLPTTQALTAD